MIPVISEQVRWEAAHEVNAHAELAVLGRVNPRLVTVTAEYADRLGIDRTKALLVLGFVHGIVRLREEGVRRNVVRQAYARARNRRRCRILFGAAGAVAALVWLMSLVWGQLAA